MINWINDTEKWIVSAKINTITVKNEWELQNILDLAKIYKSWTHLEKEKIHDEFAKIFGFDKVMWLFFDWIWNLFSACVKLNWESRTLLNVWLWQDFSFFSEIQLNNLNYELVDIFYKDFKSLSAKFKLNKKDDFQLKNADLWIFLNKEILIWNKKYKISESRILQTKNGFSLKFDNTGTDTNLINSILNFFNR